MKINSRRFANKTATYAPIGREWGKIDVGFWEHETGEIAVRDPGNAQLLRFLPIHHFIPISGPSPHSTLVAAQTAAKTSQRLRHSNLGKFDGFTNNSITESPKVVRKSLVGRFVKLTSRWRELTDQSIGLTCQVSKESDQV